MRRSEPGALGPRRRLFQWGLVLAVLIIPFGRREGRGLLRIDLSRLSLDLFGHRLPLREFYLLLPAGLALVLLFLLVTLVFGRVWCGWACPQTVLAEVAEALARRLGLQLEGGQFHGSLGRRLLLQAGFLALSLLVGANLVWYFVPPVEFFPRLLGGELGTAAISSLLLVAGTVYFDLAFVRRLLCREFCPYGRFQAVLVDPGTLTLHFPAAEAARCRQCGACVRACPMGIDIRRGFQVECINCGRCLDACREVMARRGEEGIIRYAFGLQGKGPRALLNPRLTLVATAFLGLSAIMAGALLTRPEAALQVRRQGTTSRLLDDGRTVNVFTVLIDNRQNERAELTVRAELADGPPLELRGPAGPTGLPAGRKKELVLAVLFPGSASSTSMPAIFFLEDREGRVLAKAEAVLTPAPQPTRE